MAVYFYTTDPGGLLGKFRAAITQSQILGKITTWELSGDGKYYTHKARDWAKKAWFSPVMLSDRLTFNILRPNASKVTPVIYGYYHGHLIETFVNHFDKSFTLGCATALAQSQDNCG